MKISATSSGGFAGIGEQINIDTEHCAGGKALEAALADSGFFGAAVDEQESIGADLMRWTIDASDGARRHSLSFSDDGGAQAGRWRQLLAQIRACA